MSESGLSTGCTCGRLREQTHRTVDWFRRTLGRRKTDQTELVLDAEDRNGESESGTTSDSPENYVPVRGQWNNKAEFILSCLGYAVGLGNIWRFPWMVTKNGGGAFLIPYAIIFVILGFPVFLTEVSLGQFAGVGPTKLISRLSPLCQGLGIAMVIGSYMGLAGYSMVIGWSFYYMFASLTSHLPWDGCQNEYNTQNCYSYNEKVTCEGHSGSGSVYVRRTCFNSTLANMSRPELGGFTPLDVKANVTFESLSTPSQEYLYFYVYNLFVSDAGSSQEESGGVFRDVSNIGGVKYDLALCLMLAWFVIWVCVLKGIKSSGKVVYFTATFPYLVLFILLCMGARLEGSLKGIEYFLKPNISKLAEPVVWSDAAGQIFGSLSIGGGGLLTYASYNRFNNNIVRDALIVTIGNTLTSLFAGFVVFSVLGFMAHTLGQEVEDVVKSGSGLAFVAYPEIVTLIPGGPFWSFLFFFMLITLGLDSAFAGLEVVITTVTDSYPSMRAKKPWIGAAISVSLFLISLPMCTQGGLYWEHIINYYATASLLIVISIFEVGVYFWVYGPTNVLRNIEEMTNHTYSVAFHWCWWILGIFIAPVFLIVVVLLNVANLQPLTFDEMPLPQWTKIVGVFIALPTVIVIPTAMVKVIMTDYRNNPHSGEMWYKRLVRLCRPSSSWGPSYIAHQKERAAALKEEATERRSAQVEVTSSSGGDNDGSGENGGQNIALGPVSVTVMGSEVNGYGTAVQPDSYGVTERLPADV